MEICKKIEIRQEALYLVEHDTIVFSDVHLGVERSYRRVNFPLHNFEKLLEQLVKIIGNHTYARIVINGDLKEEFGTINDDERKRIAQFISICKDHAREVVIIEGNHDVLLEKMLDTDKVTFVQFLQLGDVFICHGDELMMIPKEIKTIIIGHEHPALTLREGARAETYKCHLKGTYQKKILLVTPSLSQFKEGVDVLTSSHLSPFFPESVHEFEAFIVSDEIYPFGKLKRLMV